jgi:hypothetical protein
VEGVVGRQDVLFEETVKKGEVPPGPKPVASDVIAMNLKRVRMAKSGIECEVATYLVSPGYGTLNKISVP